MDHMEIDFAALKRQSRIAAVLTALSSIIVIGSLFFSYQETARASRDLITIRSQIAQEQKDKAILDSDVASLREQKDAYTSLLNSIAAQSPQLSNTVKTAIDSSPKIASSIPRVYIQIPSKDEADAANAAALILKKAGYIVPAIQVMGAAKSPDATQLRYFYDDQTARSDISQIKQTLASAGDHVQLQATKAAKLPPPRQYELWFGASQVPHPSLH